jgi:purine-binding chemotaxis protein CheW
MSAIPHLVCRLHDALYAVDARTVKEIFGLPDLTPIEELTSSVVGVVNLRGTIVPVLDLDLRFGRAPTSYRLTDVVVVLEWDEQLLGLIVNDVKDVQEIPSSAVEPALALGRNGGPHSQFISGLAKIGDNILMVLDHTRLAGDGEALEGTVAEPAAGGLGAGPEGDATRSWPQGSTRVFWPQATAEERAVLTERARHLVRPIESKDMRGQLPLAAVLLGGEHFGVDLDIIQEFSQLHGVTPVPCCPQHIVGQINLRGDIVTLVDIAPSLNLPPAAEEAGAKVMVVQLDHLRLGIPVDDVSDVIYLRRDEMADVPATVKSAGREFLKGAAPYAGKMLGILDLRGLLTSGNLSVDEEV